MEGKNVGTIRGENPKQDPTIAKELTQWFLTWVRSNPRGSAVWFTPLVCALIQYIVIYTCFEFEEENKYPTTKGSMNACMELAGFSTSHKVKNH